MPPPPKADAPAAAAPAAAAKSDKAPPPPVAEAPAAAAAAAAKPAGGIMAWVPAILAIVIAPAATWATAEYILVPRLEKKLALPPASALASVEAPAAADATKDGKPKEPAAYEFTNVVVNLAGTMGTRYLKTTLHIVGAQKVDIKKEFEDNRPMLFDTTINVLSSLTLADLEEPGAKNVIREKLVGAYNQALKRRVVEQVYFGDFVVQ